VKSGPDVFADALVSSAAAADAGDLIFQIPYVYIIQLDCALRYATASCPGRGAAHFALLRRAGTHGCDVYTWAPDQQRTTPQERRVAQHPGNANGSNGYRLAKRQGKPNFAGK
jgi:hypothetical protein